MEPPQPQESRVVQVISNDVESQHANTERFLPRIDGRSWRTSHVVSILLLFILFTVNWFGASSSSEWTSSLREEIVPCLKEVNSFEGLQECTTKMFQLFGAPIESGAVKSVTTPGTGNKKEDRDCQKEFHRCLNALQYGTTQRTVIPFDDIEKSGTQIRLDDSAIEECQRNLSACLSGSENNTNGADCIPKRRYNVGFQATLWVIIIKIIESFVFTILVNSNQSFGISAMSFYAFMKDYFLIYAILSRS